MYDTNNSQLQLIPVWFWIIATLALVWNLMGIMAYIQQVTLTTEALAAMSEVEQALYNDTPAWINVVFAVSVFGGALGSLFLLMKKAFAEILLIISFVAVLIQMSYIFFISDSSEAFGPGGMIMPIMIIIIAALLIWLAKSSKMKGWIS